MANPLINPGKLMQGLMNSQMQSLMAEIQKKNPAVIGRLMQLYQNPKETLLQIFSGNPQAQQQVKTQLEGKGLKEQQGMLLRELQNGGVDVKGIAAKFGINL